MATFYNGAPTLLGSAATFSVSSATFLSFLMVKFLEPESTATFYFMATFCVAVPLGSAAHFLTRQ